MRSTNKLLLVYFFFVCCSGKQSYDPNETLSAEQKDRIVTSIIRFATKKPEKSTEETKFQSQYDSFYMAQASTIRFELYFKKVDDHFFLITQPAPSLVEKRHATGGRLKLSEDGRITEYEEIFRTWKMVPDTLKRRSYLLFDKMVKGESLERYYTKNSNGVDFIEFPDDRTYFDITSRKWKVK